MIYILHGQNSEAAYTRLTQILDKYKQFSKVRFDEKSSNDDIQANLNGINLFGEQKLLIFENYLGRSPKVDFNKLKQIQDKIIIFWEKSSLPKNTVSKLVKTAQVEEFKPQPVLFWFLDNLYPQNKKVLNFLDRIDRAGLLYQLQNRLLLMILSKLGASVEYASKNIQKNLQNWQWDKIRRQATRFTLDNLIAFNQGALKIDYMIKCGQTDLPEETLIKLLLLKYL